MHREPGSARPILSRILRSSHPLGPSTPSVGMSEALLHQAVPQWLVDLFATSKVGRTIWFHGCQVARVLMLFGYGFIICCLDWIYMDQRSAFLSTAVVFSFQCSRHRAKVEAGADNELTKRVVFLGCLASHLTARIHCSHMFPVCFNSFQNQKCSICLQHFDCGVSTPLSFFWGNRTFSRKSHARERTLWNDTWSQRPTPRVTWV